MHPFHFAHKGILFLLGVSLPEKSSEYQVALLKDGSECILPKGTMISYSYDRYDTLKSSIIGKIYKHIYPDAYLLHMSYSSFSPYMWVLSTSREISTSLNDTVLDQESILLPSLSLISISNQWIGYTEKPMRVLKCDTYVYSIRIPVFIPKSSVLMKSNNINPKDGLFTTGKRYISAWIYICKSASSNPNHRYEISLRKDREGIIDQQYIRTPICFNLAYKNLQDLYKHLYQYQTTIEVFPLGFKGYYDIRIIQSSS